jgi:hypothetical protein
MISFLTDITRFFKNFELLPILTDYANGADGQFWKGTTQGSFQQFWLRLAQ